MNKLCMGVLWSALALASAGCGILPEKSETTIYSPQSARVPNAAWPATRDRLVVVRPSAHKLLDSSRILVRPVPGEVQVYAGAIWEQPAPDMLQDAVVRLIEDSSKTGGVMRRGAGIAGEYALTMDIRRFDADYAGQASPAAILEVSVTLLRNGQNTIAEQHVFRAATPASSAAIKDVVHAFEQSLNTVSTDIAGWTLQRMR